MRKSYSVPLNRGAAMLLLAERPSASTPPEAPALASALANLEAASFNLWLIANTIGAKIEHGADPQAQPLGRALRQEVGVALTALFEWRRLRWASGVDAVDHS
jgi:hypothetical protein